MIRFHCSQCDRGLKVADALSGKQGRCPHCQEAIMVPTAAIPEDSPIPLSGLRLKQEPDSPPSTSHVSPTESPMPTSSPSQDIPKGQRKYTPLVDIFLYPTSVPGMINLFLLWIMIPLLGFLPTLPMMRIRIIGLFLFSLGPAYLFYYLADCVRDSADGGTRAPENMNNQPDLWSLFGQLLYLVATVILLALPSVGYYFWHGPDAFFYALVGIAVFLLPMALLATIIMDSTTVFFPWLWISSIAVTVIPYLGLVILGSLTTGAVTGILLGVRPTRPILILLLGFALYTSMIAAHVLGRFYFRYEKQLNWEA